MPLRPLPLRTFVAVVLVAALAWTLATPPPALGAPPRWRAPGRPPADRYHPPVQAPITDPFRAPAGPYGPGNRGIEYATAPGTPVLACGPGIVTFAGVIAGQRYVTVRHPDGIRTSSSYLATIAVREGQAVTGTTVLGLAGPRLHLGARRGDAYFDPATLWGQPVGPTHPVLVPLGGGRGAAARGPAGPGPAPGEGAVVGHRAGSALAATARAAASALRAPTRPS